MSKIQRPLARSMRTIRSNLYHTRTSSSSSSLATLLCLETPEILDCISPENLQPTIKICIDGLNSTTPAVKCSAAAILRLLAKNRPQNRALIGESGAIPSLIPLLHSSDRCTQEHAVTALLNLSLFEENKTLITKAGAIKPLIHVLESGNDESKQNAACALLNLSLLDDNKSLIGAYGAIPPLVELLKTGSDQGRKDAITALYKLCSVEENKERAVSAGIVKLLVDMIADEGNGMAGERNGMAEKAIAVLSSLAVVETGREEIVEEGGIEALVEVIEDGSMMGKEFALVTLIQLCGESVGNRGLLVREGCIPPLVELSECGTPRAKHKAETLLGYLRESRKESSSPSP